MSLSSSKDREGRLAHAGMGEEVRAPVFRSFIGILKEPTEAPLAPLSVTVSEAHVPSHRVAGPAAVCLGDSRNVLSSSLAGQPCRSGTA